MQTKYRNFSIILQFSLLNAVQNGYEFCVSQWRYIHHIHFLNIITNITVNILPPLPPQILKSIDRSNIAIEPRKSSLHQRIQPLCVVHIQLVQCCMGKYIHITMIMFNLAMGIFPEFETQCG